MEGKESLFSAPVRRIVSQLVKIPNRAGGHNSAERLCELESVWRKRYGDENPNEINAKRDRRAEVVSEYGIHAFKFWLFCVSLPSWGERWLSWLSLCSSCSPSLLFLLSSSSSPSFFPLSSGIFHQRRVGLMVDGDIDVPYARSSFYYLSLFSPSLFVAGAFLFLPWQLWHTGVGGRGPGWGQAGEERNIER